MSHQLNFFETQLTSDQGYEADLGSCRQPYLRPARLVQGVEILKGQLEARLVVAS
jgi:hypothetical protein